MSEQPTTCYRCGLPVVNSFGAMSSIGGALPIANAFLSPADYDAAEQAAMEDTPNRIIECCRPVTFAEVGYPTSIRSLRGARRFVDVMHEGRTELTMNVLGALTETNCHYCARLPKRSPR